MRVERLCRLLFGITFLLPGTHARATEIRIDCGKVIGDIRPLHGVNNGPLDVGGTVDLSSLHKELSLPFVRLHDCHWPNPDVVDLHAVFPNPDADPSLESSYDFARTDTYLKAIVEANGPNCRIIYRLGESIEHGKDRRRLAPPKDAQRFAAACAGIVRHYNDGWAGGFHFGIRDWEIWNEPDNRPNQWTGSDEDFLRLYVTTARLLKEKFPDLMIGGPALGNVGTMKGDALEPTAFTLKILGACRKESAALDFFSWHLYSADPTAFAREARAVRKLLDGSGFQKTHSYLTEWNYLPDNDWSSLLGGQGERRERFFERIGGAEGAAFTASALIALQDAPLDAATYYAGDTNPFGLFTRHGLQRKNFYTMLAMKHLTDTPVRLQTTIRAASGQAGGAIACLAGRNRRDDGTDRLNVLVSNFNCEDDKIDLTITGLPWNGASDVQTLLLNADHDLTSAVSSRDFKDVHVVRTLTAPAVCLIQVQCAKGP